MGIVADLIQVYIIILLARAILSWVVPPGGHGFLADANRVVFKFTEPVLAPVRRLMPPVRLGGVAIDLSLFVVVLVLQIVRSSL